MKCLFVTVGTKKMNWSNEKSHLGANELAIYNQLSNFFCNVRRLY